MKLVEEDANMSTEEDANSPLEVLRLIPGGFLEEHLSERWGASSRDTVRTRCKAGRTTKTKLFGRMTWVIFLNRV